MKIFLYVSLEVGWVTEIWGVMFLMVPPKDKFVEEYNLQDSKSCLNLLEERQKVITMVWKQKVEMQEYQLQR